MGGGCPSRTQRPREEWELGEQGRPAGPSWRVRGPEAAQPRTDHAGKIYFKNKTQQAHYKALRTNTKHT